MKSQYEQRGGGVGKKQQHSPYQAIMHGGYAVTSGLPLTHYCATLVL